MKKRKGVRVSHTYHGDKPVHIILDSVDRIDLIERLLACDGVSTLTLHSADKRLLYVSRGRSSGAPVGPTLEPRIECGTSTLASQITRPKTREVEIEVIPAEKREPHGIDIVVERKQP